MVSLAPVSQDPPLVLWSVDRRSGSLDVWLESPGFALHLLAADQEALAWQFAKKGEEKFAGLRAPQGRHGRAAARRGLRGARVRGARAARRRRPRDPGRPRRRAPRRPTAHRSCCTPAACAASLTEPTEPTHDSKGDLVDEAPARRQGPEARHVLGELLVRDGRHEDRGPLEGDLGRQPPAREGLRCDGDRLHAPDRPLDRLRR